MNRHDPEDLIDMAHFVQVKANREERSVSNDEAIRVAKHIAPYFNCVGGWEFFYERVDAMNYKITHIRVHLSFIDDGRTRLWRRQR